MKQKINLDVKANFNGGVLICTNGYHLTKTARDLAREKGGNDNG